LIVLASKVAKKTIIRRVKTTENPKRHILTHHKEPNRYSKATPKAIRTNQNSQLARERTEVLRSSNIGSLRIKPLIVTSERKFIAKRAVPKKIPANNLLED
jgi:hypothetical protein